MELTKRKKYDRALGFSALDLLITFALVMVLAGLTIQPIRRSLDRYRVTGEARRIAAELQRARSLAQTKGSVFQVLIDQTNNALQVVDLSDASNQRAQLRLKYGTMFESTPANTLRFFPKGHARGGSILLASLDGQRARVTVLASGRTQVDVEDDVLEDAEGPENAQEEGPQ